MMYVYYIITLKSYDLLYYNLIGLLYIIKVYVLLSSYSLIILLFETHHQNVIVYFLVHSRVLQQILIRTTIRTCFMHTMYTIL